MKHTPGPWKYESPPNLTGQAHVVLAGDDEFMVCECYEDDDTQNEANGRLIAAAPDLLDALQAIIGHDSHLLNPHRVAAARVAIAKVEGRD